MKDHLNECDELFEKHLKDRFYFFAQQMPSRGLPKHHAQRKRTFDDFIKMSGDSMTYNLYRSVKAADVTISKLLGAVEYTIDLFTPEILQALTPYIVQWMNLRATLCPNSLCNTTMAVGISCLIWPTILFSHCSFIISCGKSRVRKLSTENNNLRKDATRARDDAQQQLMEHVSLQESLKKANRKLSTENNNLRKENNNLRKDARRARDDVQLMEHDSTS